MRIMGSGVRLYPFPYYNIKAVLHNNSTIMGRSRRSLPPDVILMYYAQTTHIQIHDDYRNIPHVCVNK